MSTDQFCLAFYVVRLITIIRRPRAKFSTITGLVIPSRIIKPVAVPLFPDPRSLIPDHFSFNSYLVTCTCAYSSWNVARPFVSSQRCSKLRASHIAASEETSHTVC